MLLKSLLAGYAARGGRYDELLAAPHQPRPHWDAFLHSLAARGAGSLSDTLSLIEREVRENGITYNVYADPQGMDRPWAVDPLPLLLSAKQLASFKTPPADEAVAPTKATKAEKAAERSAEPSPEIQQLLARFDEMQSVASTLKQERDTLSKQLLEAKERSRKTLIKEAFITASKDISFFDPMEVYTLIENQIDG